MTVLTQLAPGKITIVDSNGVPLVGGTVGFYQPSTLTPKDTWQDSAGASLNINPLTLDARGQAVIWGSGYYRQIVHDKDGVLVWDQVVLAPLLGAGGSTVTLDTVAALQASQIDGSVNALTLAGYYAAGDLGGGLYKRTSAGAGTGKIQSADGAWWLLCAAEPDVRQYGTNGGSGDAAIINAAIVANYGKRLHLGPVHPCSTGIVAALPISLIPCGSGTVTSGSETFYGTRLYATADMPILLDINVTAGGGNEDMGGYVGPLIADGAGHATRCVVVRGSHCVKWHLDQVNAINFKTIGIDIQGNHSHLLTKCQGAVGGANLAGDAGIAFTGANGCLADCCNAEAVSGNAMLLNAGFENTIIAGAQEGCSRHGTFITGTAQGVTVTGVDYEANGTLAANTYADILIDGTNNSGCKIFANRSSSVAVKYSFWNRGLGNSLEDNTTTSVLICWAGATALNGTFKGNLEFIHSDTVWGPAVQVINTKPQGLSTTTPTFPLTGVTLPNPVTNGPVEISFSAVGTVAAWTKSDGGGGTFTAAGPLRIGQRIRLSPSGTIVFTHTGAATWRWEQV